VTEVAIHFKRPPLLLFKTCAAAEQMSPNTLLLRLQPDEGISLGFEVKAPGLEICVNALSLDFSYRAAFGANPADAYETLLLDCMRGDLTLFIRYDWLELAWALMDPFLRRWQEDGTLEVFPYSAGSWGPKEANEFIERDGRRWRTP
jgi:glucose-6-phosphate 1-dehydrogenase